MKKPKAPTTARELEVSRLHRQKMTTAGMAEVMGVTPQRVSALLTRLGLSPNSRPKSRARQRTAAQVRADSAALRERIARVSTQHPTWPASAVADVVKAKVSTVRRLRHAADLPRPAPYQSKPRAPTGA